MMVAAILQMTRRRRRFYVIKAFGGVVTATIDNERWQEVATLYWRRCFDRKSP